MKIRDIIIGMWIGRVFSFGILMICQALVSPLEASQKEVTTVQECKCKCK